MRHCAGETECGITDWRGRAPPCRCSVRLGSAREVTDGGLADLLAHFSRFHPGVALEILDDGLPALPKVELALLSAADTGELVVVRLRPALRCALASISPSDCGIGPIINSWRLRALFHFASRKLIEV
ncbi:MAG: hypothetical protein PVI92_14980 [Chromatiales bacterium]